MRKRSSLHPSHPNGPDTNQKIAWRSSRLEGRCVCVAGTAAVVAQQGLTHFLFLVGGEKSGLVARSRLRLLLLWLLLVRAQPAITVLS